MSLCQALFCTLFVDCVSNIPLLLFKCIGLSNFLCFCYLYTTQIALNANVCVLFLLVVVINVNYWTTLSSESCRLCFCVCIFAWFREYSVSIYSALCCLAALQRAIRWTVMGNLTPAQSVSPVMTTWKGPMAATATRRGKGSRTDRVRESERERKVHLSERTAPLDCEIVRLQILDLK